MPGTGLEPARLAAPDPKSGASANFATPAYFYTAVYEELINALEFSASFCARVCASV